MKHKRYIFLTNDIGSVGGGQLYLSSKVDWLEKEGWKVDVYYFYRTPLMLENLRRFESNYIRNFEFRFAALTAKERRETADLITKNIPVGSNIVFESYSCEMGLWGEYLARITNGKHICYLINETYPNITPSMREFLLFKLKQKLLYGITPKSIPSILPEASGDATFLRAEGCSQRNAPDIYDRRLDMIPDEGFTILSIGRLEKPYMPKLFEEVKTFARSCGDKVNFVVVGDTNQKNVRDSLLASVKDVKNLNLLFWGYTFPVPRQLFLRSDVFVGCAGSALMAFKERLTAITIDANDNMGIGILGETTDNRLFRSSDEPPIAAGLLLDSVYKTIDSRKEERSRLDPIVEEPDFKHHKEIIDQSFDNTYFPVETVKNQLIFDIIYKSIKRVGGNAFLYRLKKIKQKIIPY